MNPFQRRDIDIRTVEQEKAIGTFATKVYGWMALGLVTTACVAFAVFHSGLYRQLFPFWWICGFLTFGIACYMTKALQSLRFQTMMLLYLAYATLEGVFFGTVLPVYAKAYGGQVIWTAFATAAFVYGFAVVYGTFTKANLTSLKKILMFALVGLIVVTLAYLLLSFFMPLPGIYLAICYLGLILFIGLTAYDAQQIRLMARQADQVGSTMAYKFALMMALTMYINVIMIFWYLLQIFSSNRK